jgi:hypothetical protein
VEKSTETLKKTIVNYQFLEQSEKKMNVKMLQGQITNGRHISIYYTPLIINLVWLHSQTKRFTYFEHHKHFQGLFLHYVIDLLNAERELKAIWKERPAIQSAGCGRNSKLITNKNNILLNVINTTFSYSPALHVD